jgi:branched-chain amino acid transport system ATP-binding protein
MTRAHLLEVEDLHTYIGQHHILEGVSLRIRADAVTVLLGRNGAGKTTTMRTVMGVLHPSQGAIRFDGHPIDHLPPYEIARRGIGYVPEGQGIFGTLTVDENLRVARLADDAESARRLAQVLALFPDPDRVRHARAATLSGGQKQMLAIARAFVTPHRLLLIDEPSKGLAPIVTTSRVPRRVPPPAAAAAAAPRSRVRAMLSPRRRARFGVCLAPGCQLPSST